MGTMASQIISLTMVYSSVYFGADERKHQSFASLVFVRGIHRWPVNSLHKWPVTRKMFPFDVVIMHTLIARFMGPIWGPPGADRTQVGRMLAPWILLSGYVLACRLNAHRQCWIIVSGTKNKKKLHRELNHNAINIQTGIRVWKCRLQNVVHFISASISIFILSQPQCKGFDYMAMGR